MAINNTTTGKLKYIFYVVILLFFISNVSAVSHTGEVDLQVSVSAPDWSLLNASTYGTEGAIKIEGGLRYKGVAYAGTPDTMVFRDADIDKEAAYAWADIPQNVGGSFALYNGGVFSGSGGITVHRVNDVDVGRVDIWYQFDDTDFITNDSEITYDVTLYASPISEYYNQFVLEKTANSYSTQHAQFMLESSSYGGCHASWATGANSYVEYDYYGHFINEYNISLSGATASTVITRDGLGQQLASSKFKLKNSTYSVVYSQPSYITTNSTTNHDNGSYYYYLDVENYGEILIYDAISTPPPPPQAEDTIEWGADSYVVDDTGSYSWVLSDSNWDTWLYSKKASIYRAETLVHEVSLPTQTGTHFYTLGEEGSYTVKLRHTSALLPHKTIDTDTVNVLPAGDSYIHVNNTIVVGQHFDINFSYGFTPKDYFVNGVKAKYFHEDSNEWLLEKTWGVSDLYPMTANTIYQVSGTHTINFEGDYIFELYDFDNGVVATTPIITAIFDSTTPTLNISTSYINISKTDYVMGNIMDGFYGIDNTNYTYNNYHVIYNYQYDTTSMNFPLTEQASGFYGTLVQTDIHGDWIAGGEIPVIPGNNKISIYAENSTTRFELAYVNFTVSAYDEDGYGLQLSSYDACINEEVLISVISPADANLTIFSPTGMPIKTFTLNGSTTIKYWFPTSGMYSLELYKSGEGISRATVTIYISDCAEDDIIEPPSGEMDDMYINLFNAMTIPAFWGMIIFIGFIGGLAIKRDKNGDALVSGNGLAFIAFGLLNLLSIIGLFAPYTFYIIVSTWIFAGMFFGVGRYLARGEG